MGNNYANYRVISSSLTCNVCGQDLSTCACNKTVLTGTLMGGGSANAIGTSNTGISSSYTYFLTCNICGGPFGACSCSQPNMYPGNPNYTPNIIQPAIMPPTWSGTSINRDEVYTYLKVLDVETKERYEHSGFFHVERKNEQDGIYGSISGLILPVDFKDVFALVRKEDSFKIWQIRSPLVFQIDFQLDANKEESHYFTLTSVKDVQIGEKLLVITEARFQEVPNPIELCQLIEIQRVFNKLLRRI